jgi:sugar lactone lactonase YvrE
LVTASTGIITTIVGTGSTSFSGDGGLATSAGLNNPAALAFDSVGNIYIADQSNNCIRKINTNTKTINTVVNHSNATVKECDSTFTTKTNAAQLRIPVGITIDNKGICYACTYGSCSVEKINFTTGLVNYWFGYGNSNFMNIDCGPVYCFAFNSPNSMAADSRGNIYIDDQSLNIVYKLNTLTNNIYRVAGMLPSGPGKFGYSGDGGVATNAMLGYPGGIALDTFGNLFIADTYNNVVRRVDSKTQIITTVAGNGKAGYSGDGGSAITASLNQPYAVTVDESGNLYIADMGNNVIRKVSNVNNLPLTLFAFTATLNNSKIEANWQTSTELNISHFIIQYSTDGTSFTDIGTVKAIGNGANGYQFTDNNPTPCPLTGVLYYRLKTVDKDGSFAYSKVVSAQLTIDHFQCSISPNPAKDNVTISFCKAVDKATIAVYDISGKAVITQSFSGNANACKLHTQSLKNGVYVLKVNTSTGSYNQKLLINK